MFLVKVWWGWSCILVLLLCSCMPSSTDGSEVLDYGLDDAVIQQIFNFKTRRNTAALLPYLAVPNLRHRYVATLALGSLRDSQSIQALANVLRTDKQLGIRRAAAFALGQTGSSKAADVLTDQFLADSSRAVQAAMLEALGRCGAEKHLRLLCAARSYPSQDTVLHRGWLQALYRFAQRGLVHEEGTSRVIKDYLANALTPTVLRIWASNYLFRAGDLDLKPYEDVLVSSMLREREVKVLVPLTLALAKISGDTVRRALELVYRQPEMDYRVKVAILRGLQQYAYDSLRPLLEEALLDKHWQVRYAAADFCFHNGLDRDAGDYLVWAEAEEDLVIRLRLEAAALRHWQAYRGQQKAQLSQRLIKDYQEDSSAFYKALRLEVLGEYAWNYTFLLNQLKLADSTDPSGLLRSGAGRGLRALCSGPSFQRDLAGSRPRVRLEIYSGFRALFERADLEAGALAEAAEVFLADKEALKEVFVDWDFVKAAKARLKMPEAVETYLLLSKLEAKLEGGLFVYERFRLEVLQRYLAEIDFPILQTLGERPIWTLETRLGPIRLELWPKLAPATVAQILRLIQSGFFNGRLLHRLVPGFVVQGGCPREDGWASVSDLLPSEFSEASFEDAGYLGMASAGSDTESSQFFITLGSAFHLDGKYTIFGKVIEGEALLHQLKLGDVILQNRLE